MEIVLIGISFFFGWAGLSLNASQGRRLAFLKMAVIHGFFVVISTEALSLFKRVNYSLITFLWMLFALIHFVFFLKKLELQQESLAGYLKKLITLFSPYPRGPLLFLYLGIFSILSITFTTALLSPPNNPDAMAYHLPRVMHWAQNQSVQHYPTADLRQISFSPGVGYHLLHVYLLTNSDRFFNSIQWFSFLGCILGLSLLIKLLNGASAQQTTALLCATVPMAVLQSMTTQTDLMVAFWLITAVCFLFTTSQNYWSSATWFGAALSLAIVSKPTAILFGAPFGFLFAWREGRTLFQKYSFSYRSLRILLRKILFVGLFAFSLSLPHFLRNQETFGLFLGVDTDTRNTTIGFLPTLSNIFRNTALNLPWMPLWKKIQILHEQWIPQAIQSEITLKNATLHQELCHTTLVPHEDFVGAPLHFILLVSALFWFFWCFLRKQQTLQKEWKELFLANMTGFFLFCGLLKWQEWGNRLLLPCFLLFIPFTGFWLSQIRYRKLKNVILSLLFSIGLFYSLTPIRHPLIELPSRWTNSLQTPSILTLKREDIYLVGNQNIAPGFYQFVDQVLQKNVHTLGIEMSIGEWEYALWALLKSRGFKPFRIKHIQVKNGSQKLVEEFPTTEVGAVLKIQPHPLK